MILLVTVLGGHFYIKINITIIFTSLITNPLLSLFLPFIETKKKNQEVGGLVAKNIYVSCLYRVALYFKCMDIP